MNDTTRKLFQLIFREAHVIDFDFSIWDKQISLVVIGGLVDGNFEGSGPIHRVAFIDVDEIQWKSHHLGIVLDSEEEHCQWVIVDFRIWEEQENYAIQLKSVAPPCPDLNIRCRTIAISEVNIEDINEVNPKWNRPSCPLARPGFEELSAQLRVKKEGKKGRN